jgi:carbon monoxide dehydrogenase subunit G
MRRATQAEIVREEPMRITGTTMLQAPVESIYAALVDPAVLAQVIPGCTKVEQLSEGSYCMTVTAGIASIKGAYQVDVRLTGADGAPHKLQVHASGAGLPGHFSADLTIALADSSTGSTMLSYSAAVTVGGPVGALGRFILTRAAKKSIADCFVAADRVLRDRAKTELVTQH